MSRVRIGILGGSLALLTAGCGLIGVNKESSTKDTKKSQDASAGASVKDRQFSLSLPELPDMPKEAKFKAHLRIFRGEAPVAMEDCAAGPVTNDDIESMPPMMDPNDHGGEPAQAPESQPEMAQVQSKEKSAESAHDGSNGMLLRNKRAYGVVYENSVPYAPGTTIGPVLLDRGGYTAILDIYGEQGKEYTGHAWFKVGNEIQEIAMRMTRTGGCGGQGGVIINPVIPGEVDQISACNFLEEMFFPAVECINESARCYYRDFKGPSHCSVIGARYGLIKHLCAKDVMVNRENFLGEIMCESSVMPPEEPIQSVEPTPPGEPAPPVKPMPPQIGSCEELKMSCKNQSTKYCVAYYQNPATGQKMKAYSDSGNYCLDRKAVLSEMCDQKIQSYDMRCD